MSEFQLEWGMNANDTTDPTALLNYLLYILGIEAFMLLVSSLSASSAYNAGFNVILQSLLACGFPVCAYVIINRVKTADTVGVVIGASIILLFQYFMSMIYWGQLSLCEPVDTIIKQYSCDNIPAYRAVSFFSFILFATQFFFSMSIITYRAQLFQYYGNEADDSGDDRVEQGDVKPYLYDPQALGDISS